MLTDKLVLEECSNHALDACGACGPSKYALLHLASLFPTGYQLEYCKELEGGEGACPLHL
jgi:hypothetical protein